jgi:hypothetical protein
MSNNVDRAGDGLFQRGDIWYFGYRDSQTQQWRDAQRHDADIHRIGNGEEPK